MSLSAVSLGVLFKYVAADEDPDGQRNRARTRDKEQKESADDEGAIILGTDTMKMNHSFGAGSFFWCGHL